MILASHNSWASKPKHWYMYPFLFMAKCQNKTIEQQWDCGVRMFDLRLFFDSKDRVSVRHGILTFKTCYSGIMHDLSMLQQKAVKDSQTVYVRVMLEQNHKNKKQDALERNFSRFCALLKECFPHILFFSGARKFDNQQLYDFNTPEPKIIHRYSSTTSLFGEDKRKWYAKIDDFWPWLYAHLHNKESLNKYANEDCYLMLDFI